MLNFIEMPSMRCILKFKPKRPLQTISWLLSFNKGCSIKSPRQLLLFPQALTWLQDLELEPNPNQYLHKQVSLKLALKPCTLAHSAVFADAF